MGILELIRLALSAFLEISKDFKLAVAALQERAAAESLALRVKALQDIRSAISEDDYKKAAKELHDAISSL